MEVFKEKARGTAGPGTAGYVVGSGQERDVVDLLLEIKPEFFHHVECSRVFCVRVPPVLHLPFPLIDHVKVAKEFPFQTFCRYVLPYPSSSSPSIFYQQQTGIITKDKTVLGRQEHRM